MRRLLDGTRVELPILLAPTAYQRLAHPDGELATARAAGEAGTILVLSTLATTSLEDVAAAAAGPLWFQIYVQRDRGLTRALVERAAAAGYRALVLTVDTPLLGRRLADERNRFALPPGMTMPHLPSASVAAESAAGSALTRHVGSRHDPSLTWRDVEWLRSLSPLPIVLKGILREDDATRAVLAGAAAVLVSNHGARQLDGTPPALAALPGVARAVTLANQANGTTCELYFDGGIRWGTDVLKALALGARAVLIGRPGLWGLAAGGQAGVRRVLEILRDELSTAMALAGCASLDAIERDLVRPRAN